nr:TPA_asm: ATP synthase F0 subunit 8 [Pseudomyrmex pallidus]
MPQMSPLMWVMILIVNLFLMYILITHTHYLPYPPNPKFKENTMSPTMMKLENKWNFKF